MVECAEVLRVAPEELVEPEEMSEFRKGHREARRLELPVVDWHTDYDAKAWELSVPLVLYELWPSTSGYQQLRSSWTSLDENERAAVGLPTSTAGHLGSTMALVPKLQSFFADTHNLVICGDESLAQTYGVGSEVLDGDLTISRACAPLSPEPAGQRTPETVLQYLALHYRNANLASLSEPLKEDPDAVCRLPSQVHGMSGSDWRLTLTGVGGVVDVSTTGLIRGLGDGYFTSEPWRARAASLGFSGPARIIHVPPTTEGHELALSALRKVATGTSIRIADPFADREQLERFGSLLYGARVLTGPRASQRGLADDWFRINAIEVRVLSSLHDRFIVGASAGAVMGTSLNGLGKRHSFLVIADAVMQHLLVETFEELWNGAIPISQ
jgi:hypothetical protein